MSENAIPQTALEAESFLWHALNHVSGLILYRRKSDNEQACAIIRKAICIVQNQQITEEFLATDPLITPEIREAIRKGNSLCR